VLQEVIDALGLASPVTYLVTFLAASLLMVWRLESMLDHGLEGTALGTLVMPYCSGLGNLIFVFILVKDGGPASEVLTNCLVNNVTNLTLLLGLPAVIWGLPVLAGSKVGKKRASKAAKTKAAAAKVGAEVNRLSLLLTLAAVLFFTAAAWILAEDGRLRRTDGAMLIGLFLFWQTFQLFDVLKNNVQRRVSLGLAFYVDVILVGVSAWGLYESIDWIVTWITAQKGGFISAENLGWLTGWLMVLPNALLALYWGYKRRADIVYSSQIGDGHICIPLCIGLLAVLVPVSVPAFFGTGLLLMLAAVVFHAFFLLVFGGMPRWAGGLLLAAYGWFLWAGLA
jgi:cation:H+ antiporter